MSSQEQEALQRAVPFPVPILGVILFLTAASLRSVPVIHAAGELEASHKLLEAAGVLAQRAEAKQLRYLQTLTQIAGDKSSTIVFPVPLDLLQLASWQTDHRPLLPLIGCIDI